ncbi:hypothetical protein P152DRAFT_459912 [Eremomyces bilateralis CBS 781.70]|uniref:P-loop containing nucleoside triphosphate hydrolase protein n=1 Tax=Eremomyces bilateralis CBS 781.70 TaxID=1392243 RepID=A0A6G1FZE1_9PEZI|nr:uncharacterized protein P152DRAFT_459912 [Eremomyces bilateralis CBS 781.70]KAF1811040.1 hypothetical protein P152DRAFT_459912 [Eremomyces bilateralis CBS 781.70]
MKISLLRRQVFANTLLRCFPSSLNCIIHRSELARAKHRPSRPTGSQWRRYTSIRGAAAAHQETVRLPEGAEIGEETIFALSTAPGPAAIAIVRISGPLCEHIYNHLCPDKPLLKPRHATVRTLYSPHIPPSPDTILDTSALLLYFPSPNTFTGQDLLELHIHGGPATVRAVLSAIPTCSGPLSPTHPTNYPRRKIRPADPGEFTRLAFHADRLSLPQIESLSATLSASTERARRAAIRGSGASLTAQYEAWRKDLIGAMGMCEALIDFSEDQAFEEGPSDLVARCVELVEDLRGKVTAVKENATRGELMREGISVALLGKPNAGKSSLLNRIVGREAAIVSSEEGTTRDVVEVSVDLEGWLVRVGDMAGLRKGEASNSGGSGVGVVEREGIRRAKERALASDLVIVMASIEDVGDITDIPKLVLDPEVVETTREALNKGIEVVVAVNKVDKLCKSFPGDNLEQYLEGFRTGIRSVLPTVSSERILFISCKGELPSATSTTQDTIQVLLRTLSTVFTEMTTPLDSNATGAWNDARPVDKSIWQESLGATTRQKLLLDECDLHLQDFLDSADGETTGEADIVMAAEHLRSAAECFARITGRGSSGDVEEILGVVFEK